MKTIREIRLENLIQIARENVANSDNAILKIYEDFKDGKIPANRAKREYKKVLPAFLTDLNRYNYLRLALRPDTNTNNEDPAFWESYYNGIFA